MKYIDYTPSKHRRSQKRTFTMDVSFRKFFAAKRKKKTVHYKMRFYLVILFILGSSFFYVRHQVVTGADSVFTDLYQLIAGRLPDAMDQGRDASSHVRAVAPNNTQPKTKKQQMALREIWYYYASMNAAKNRLELTAQKAKTPLHVAHADVYHSIIAELLALSGDERKAGASVIHVFSEQVALFEAWLEEDVLMLDFNAAFEHNRYGDRGLTLQIQQILWTFFKNDILSKHFNAISFLIEGKRKQAIGGDGMFLKPFYTKEDMKRVIYVD